MNNLSLKNRWINMLFSLFLGATFGLGLLLGFGGIVRGEDVTAPTTPPSPLGVGEWRMLDRRVIVEGVSVVDVATAIVVPTQSVILTTVRPLTTTIYVPAGAVTAPLTLTLRSLARPSFPPTLPWIVWGGRAFSLTAQREGQVVGNQALLTPFTATVDFYGSPGFRWMLMHWVSPTWEMARCAGQTGVVEPSRIEQAVCSGFGEYIVVAAPRTLYLPIIRK